MINIILKLITTNNNNNLLGILLSIRRHISVGQHAKHYNISTK